LKQEWLKYWKSELATYCYMEKWAYTINWIHQKYITLLMEFMGDILSPIQSKTLKFPIVSAVSLKTNVNFFLGLLL
jgi:hypothetical protein